MVEVSDIMAGNHTFPDPSMNDITGLGGHLNDITGDMFGPVALLTIFFVVFALTGIREPEVGLTVGSWVAGVMGVFFYIMGWIADDLIYIPVLLMCIGFALLFMKKGG